MQFPKNPSTCFNDSLIIKNQIPHVVLEARWASQYFFPFLSAGRTLLGEIIADDMFNFLSSKELKLANVSLLGGQHDASNFKGWILYTRNRCHCTVNASNSVRFRMLFCQGNKVCCPELESSKEQLQDMQHRTLTACSSFCPNAGLWFLIPKHLRVKLTLSSCFKPKT